MDTILENFPQISRLLNGLVMAAVAVGIVVRRRPRAHIPIMISCFAVDLANVLVLEILLAAGRKGVETLVWGGEPILVFHICVSLVSLACYGVALATGWKLLRRGACRRAHRINAAIFLMMRVLNFITCFWVGS